MAIKGISEIRRLPRIGKFRLGIKKQKGSEEYPAATDYFVVAEDVTDEVYVKEVGEVYGDKPKELDIIFPCDDIEVLFPQFYKRYGSSTGLVCRGDGVSASCRANGDMKEIECLGRDCDFYKQRKCTEVGNLLFMLPKIGGLGVWQIDTGSYHSIVQINSAIAFIQGIAGRISGIPLKLILRPIEVSPDGKKKTVYVMDIHMPQAKIGKLLEQADQLEEKGRLGLPESAGEEKPEELYPEEEVPKRPANEADFTELWPLMKQMGLPKEWTREIAAIHFSNDSYKESLKEMSHDEIQDFIGFLKKVVGGDEKASKLFNTYREKAGLVEGEPLSEEEAKRLEEEAKS